ncbi:MAG: hypothetical protein R3286_17355 [Gammaproteobacteria bacterium]|nr:hypothetical protein [Gammaproteobacteria bacterium]
MMAIRTFALGQRVRMAGHCPIDFEGIGPLPGDVGRVVAVPGRGDDGGDSCVGVAFDRAPSPWLIPSRWVESAE